MRLTAATDRFRIFDDALPRGDFEAVWEYVKREEFSQVHQKSWAKVWRFCDGVPMKGPQVLAARGADGRAGDTDAPACPGRRYPTRTGIDLVIECLFDHADLFAGLVGREGREWSALTARAFLYPQGTGLSWHTDQTHYAGAFTFYAHPRWNCQWGGELFIADAPSSAEGGEDCDPPGFHLDNGGEDELLSPAGLGCYVSPRPNRLIVLRRGVPHKINKVDAAAGDHVRSTVSGFFVSE